MLFARVRPLPWYTLAASCPDVLCERQLFGLKLPADETGGEVQQPVAGLTVQLIEFAVVVVAAGLQFDAGSAAQFVEGLPRTTLVTTGWTNTGIGLLVAPSALAVRKTVPVFPVTLQTV